MSQEYRILQSQLSRLIMNDSALSHRWGISGPKRKAVIARLGSFIRPTVCLFICPSIRVCLSACLPVSLLACLSVCCTCMRIREFQCTCVIIRLRVWVLYQCIVYLKIYIEELLCTISLESLCSTKQYKASATPSHPIPSHLHITLTSL